MSNDRALATVDPNVFLAFDRLDDDQIVAEMKGAALQEYVYEFSEGGQQVRGLSKVGTDDASRIMAVKYGEALREVELILQSQDAEEALFVARVERWVIRDDGTAIQMDSAIGQKRQGKKIVRRDGKVVPNAFWYEQGGQKALRNAKQKLIPETIKQAIIASYVEQGKVRKVRTEDIAPTAAAPTNGGSESEHFCTIHNVPFYRQTSKTDPTKHWYSHKVAGTDKEFCNESKPRDLDPAPPKTNGKTEAPKAKAEQGPPDDVPPPYAEPRPANQDNLPGIAPADRATPQQLTAIYAGARNLSIATLDLEADVAAKFHCQIKELSSAQANSYIDQLNSQER